MGDQSARVVSRHERRSGVTSPSAHDVNQTSRVTSIRQRESRQSDSASYVIQTARVTSFRQRESRHSDSASHVIQTARVSQSDDRRSSTSTGRTSRNTAAMRQSVGARFVVAAKIPREQFPFCVLFPGLLRKQNYWTRHARFSSSLN